MSPALLERDREVRSIGDLLAGLIAGRGSTLILQGVPGIGKSRLLQEGVLRAQTHGITQIARFRCGELERDFPWSAALGLLGAAISASAASGDASLFEGAAGPAARLMQEPAASPFELDPFSVMHSMYVIYERLAQVAPLLLVVDDAHWGDRQSLQQLLYLARRLPQLAVGLLIATRPAAGEEPHRDLIDAMFTAEGARGERLTTLSHQGVRAFVQESGLSGASDALCTACSRLTGGNPFLLRELLFGLGESGESPEASLRRLTETPPESIVRAVVVRLNHTTPSALALGRAAAVLEDGATLGETAQLAGIALRAAAADLDRLVDAQILSPGEPLHFVHPLIRSAIYADIPDAQRASAHARAAELLEAAGAPPELVAVHLLKVPLSRTRRSLERLRNAARSANRRGAPGPAARFLARALLEVSTDEDRVEVLVELAQTESHLGDPAAVEHLRAALLLAPVSAHPRILLALGWVEHDAGRFGDAADAFEQGLRLVAADDATLAQEFEAGYLQSASLDSRRAADAAKRIRAIEDGPGGNLGSAERLLLAQVLFARTISGRHHDEVIVLARRLWDDGRLLEEEGADSQTVWHVAGALSWSDAYADAYRVINAAMKRAEAEGAALSYARGGYARSWLNLWTGRIADAVEDARRAVDIWYGGLETYLPAAIYWLVRAELERGDGEAAEQAMSLAGSAERWHGTGMDVFHLAAQGLLAAHRHDPERALDCHLRCGDAARGLQVLSPSVMPWRSSAAACAERLGRHDLSRRLTHEELELSHSVGAPRALGVSLRAAGRLAPGAEGIRMLEESVAILERCGAALEHAHSLVELGGVLRRSGQRGRARPLLIRGIEQAEAMGSVKLAHHAGEELEAAGGRRPGHPAGGTQALTASEYRVCALAADGHPNRYIAGHLAVSVKAVEWHLSQSYRKLGITGRRQLTGALKAEMR